MKTHSIEQQINHLRPTENSGLALGLHNWMIASAIVLVIVSAYFWNPIPLIIAIFLGVVGFAERHAGPNLAAAIKAYDTIKPALGEVSISVSSGDSQDHHHAVAIAYGQPDWSYEFVPQNWQPKAGRHAARIWRASNDGQPLLAAVESGILIPRCNPEKLKTDSGSTDD